MTGTMITTLFFIQLLAVQGWYVTSKQVKHPILFPVINILLQNRRTVRTIGIVLIVLATTLYSAHLGVMTGTSASIVGLMGAASLVVLLNPLSYFKTKGVVAFYVLLVALEFLI